MSDGSPSLQRNQTAAISNAVTWIRGTHNMTFGGDLRFQQFNPVNESNARGGFTFNGAATAAPGSTNTTTSGYDLADMLLGIPDTSSIAYGNADKYFRTRWWDVYANDDWRVTTKFSIQRRPALGLFAAIHRASRPVGQSGHRARILLGDAGVRNFYGYGMRIGRFSRIPEFTAASR